MHHLSFPLKKTANVAKAKPKSLIAIDVYPIEKAMPNKCKDNTNDANLSQMPEIISKPKTISKIPLIKTIRFGETIFPRNSGTKLAQLSGEVN